MSDEKELAREKARRAWMKAWATGNPADKTAAENAMEEAFSRLSPEPAEVAALRQRVAELESEVVELRQINNALMIDKTECSHENIELPEPQDEHGRRAQYPARVRCPDCGEDVEVR